MRSFLRLLLMFWCSDAYKILLFSPKFARSHIMFVGNIADILVEAGHDVVSFLNVFLITMLQGSVLIRGCVHGSEVPHLMHLSFEHCLEIVQYVCILRLCNYLSVAI